MSKYHAKQDLRQDENNSSQELIDGYLLFSLPESVRFWLLLIFEIPSLVCSCVLLYYLLTKPNLRKSLGNHVIIVLLLIGLFSQLIDIPFYLNYLRVKYVWPSIPSSCIVWWFAATGISNITNMIMAWASIERHILIFNDRWLLADNRCFYIHYCPLVGIILYGFIYYSVILLMYSCDNMYSYTSDWCLFPCFYYHRNLAMYDTIANSIMPTPIIAMFSFGLIVRVIKQKHSLHRRVQWRKFRRMTIQVLSLTALFLLFNLPMTSLVLAHVWGLPVGSTGQFEYYTYYLYHFVSLLMPFVCLFSLPSIMRRIKNLASFQTRVRILPA